MKKIKNEVKTLSDQMEEYSLRKEKIEQLKKELLVNDRWDIVYSEEFDQYYARDHFCGRDYPIDVYLRDLLPNSFFYTPECDETIIGYDPISGGIVYDFWQIGKKEMKAAEDIDADFADTAYGIGRILYQNEIIGFDGKVPPILIMQKDFIFYHYSLQGGLDYSGMDYNLHKIDISETEGIRLKTMYEIKVYREKLENKNQSEEDVNFYQRKLDDLEKQLSAMD
jgi:hypothetical protein